MRLLVFGHISHTGFGVVTENLSRRFLERGVDVRVIAVNHRGEPIKGPLAGRVWPAAINGDGFGGNISSAAITGAFWKSLDPDDDWAPDQVLVISDMSGFQGHIGRMSDAWTSVPVWHYCPIEGDNLNPSFRDIWNDPAHTNDPGKSKPPVPFRPVAMSEYGRTEISQFLGRDVPMIYHGVDVETFQPVNVAPIAWQDRILRTKAQCREVFGLPSDAKVVLRTDRLVTRKFYDVFVDAMAKVMLADPDVYLVIHCRPIDDGWNLYEELARMPPEVILSGRVKLTLKHDTWKGLPTAGLVALLNAADLYVSTTSGEGFGLTLAESLAVGVPVVTTDWAAGPEVVGPGGVVVPPLHDARGNVVKVHSSYGMDWAMPDGQAFVEPILNLLAKPHRRREMGEAGRRHVRRTFSWDAAAAQFLDLFLSAIPSEVAA